MFIYLFILNSFLNSFLFSILLFFSFYIPILLLKSEKRKRKRKRMISSQIKWSPHNRSEYLVISEYLPYFACSVSGSRSTGFIGMGNRMDLSYRNIGLFECQNLKGFNMSTPCDFSLSSTKDSCAAGADTSSQSSAVAASLPSQQGPSSRSTSPSMSVGGDAAASTSIAASAFDGSSLGESFGKSEVPGDERLSVPNSGNRPISSRHLSFSLNPAIKVSNIFPISISFSVSFRLLNGRQRTTSLC